MLNKTRAVVLLVVTFLLAGCTQTPVGNSIPGGTPTTHLTGARSVRVERRDIVATLPILHGNVAGDPTRYAEVLSPYRARVEKTYVGVGATVRPGDVLVELSLPSAKAAHDQAWMALRLAENSYESAQLRFNLVLQNARRHLDDADLAVNAARHIYPEADSQDAAPAAGQTPAMDTTVTGLPTPAAGQTQTTVTGSPAPAGQTPATQTTVTGSPAPTAAVDSALQDQAEARREVAEAGDYVHLGMLPFKQRLDAAQKIFDESRVGTRAAMIRSPIAGQVVTMTALPGEIVGNPPGQAVATIADLAFLKVLAQIGPDEAVDIKGPMDVQLTFDELPHEEFQGRVEHVATDFDSTRPSYGGRLYLLTAGFTNRDDLVRPGMHANILVIQGRSDGVLAVPRMAVSTGANGLPQVTVMRGVMRQTETIQTGLSDDHYTEVKTGLGQGDIVFLPPGK